jgi:histidinol-phosphate/aromatic aminotransferase/cobyric acid decarboxylase-like protein
MKFPLADWIDRHENCRHNLGLSGMKGSIRHPLPTTAAVRSASEDQLRAELADSVGVDPRRVFLTHGATEGNTSVMFFLAHRSRHRSPRCRVRYPEYPPLFDTAVEAGFRLTVSSRPAEVAVVSQPRNPEGDRWSDGELDRWAEGARELVVDETFREFSGNGSLAIRNEPHRWVVGSFTKFFAADDLRVGFVVAPEEAVEEYARFHGLVFNTLSNYSMAGALACLRALPRVRGEVGAVLERNRAALQSAFPKAALPVAPLYFDRLTHESGDSLAQRCLSVSVLVCPGSFFGDPSGVRLCLTRQSFPRDLEAYLAVRSPSSHWPSRPGPSASAGT